MLLDRLRAVPLEINDDLHLMTFHKRLLPKFPQCRVIFAYIVNIHVVQDT